MNREDNLNLAATTLRSDMTWEDCGGGLFIVGIGIYQVALEVSDECTTWTVTRELTDNEGKFIAEGQERTRTDAEWAGVRKALELAD